MTDEKNRIEEIARLYAESLILYGADVTEKWETARSQAAALQQAYMRGISDAFVREMEERTCDNCKHDSKSGNEWPCINCVNNAEDHFESGTGGWIPCSERLPENEQEVEITYVSKHWKTGEPTYRTCRAFYTDGTLTTEESAYVWNYEGDWEYSENSDSYIIPEGWWEGASFAEEFFPVDQPVIAWMTLPKAYKEARYE